MDADSVVADAPAHLPLAQLPHAASGAGSADPRPLGITEQLTAWMSDWLIGMNLPTADEELEALPAMRPAHVTTLAPAAT